MTTEQRAETAIRALIERWAMAVRFPGSQLRTWPS